MDGFTRDGVAECTGVSRRWPTGRLAEDLKRPLGTVLGSTGATATLSLPDVALAACIDDPGTSLADHYMAAFDGAAAQFA